MNAATKCCLTLLFIDTAQAAAQTGAGAGGATGSGDTLFWIVLTILLAIYLTRSAISALLTNPIFIIRLIIIIMFLYIFFTAIQIAYGINAMIDGTIENTADLLR